jgi:hypothetical protein
MDSLPANPVPFFSEFNGLDPASKPEEFRHYMFTFPAEVSWQHVKRSLAGKIHPDKGYCLNTRKETENFYRVFASYHFVVRPKV